MIRFIGDLSNADAQVLWGFTSTNSRILEFGVGGSTQIFAQKKPKRLVSLDNSQEWIDRTRQNLDTLGVADQAEIYLYDKIPLDTYDFVFVDGDWPNRFRFMEEAWPMIRAGGMMVVHDTRRWFDVENVSKFLTAKFEEINFVTVNYMDSNCSLICKRGRLVYENWNEGKPSWLFGNGEPGPLEEWQVIEWEEE
jgi:precorrin-6B methylase 2